VKKIVLLLLISVVLMASDILSYNVYNRTKRVDIMFTFDTPYQGIIKEIKRSSKIILQLYGLSVDAPAVKHINSPLVSKVTITPLDNYVQIVAFTGSNTNLQIDKTTDKYGLRLRFIPKVVITDKTNILTHNHTSFALKTQQDLDIPTSYYIVVAFLFIAAALLFFTKRKINKGTSTQKSQPAALKKRWFFKDQGNMKDTVNVRFTKQIDKTTSIMMLDYGEFNYLILNGQSSVLLDKFENDKPIANNRFDELLQEHTQEIDKLLQATQTQEDDEPFELYKNKASSIAYDL